MHVYSVVPAQGSVTAVIPNLPPGCVGFNRQIHGGYHTIHLHGGELLPSHSSAPSFHRSTRQPQTARNTTSSLLTQPENDIHLRSSPLRLILTRKSPHRVKHDVAGSHEPVRLSRSPPTQPKPLTLHPYIATYPTDNPSPTTRRRNPDSVASMASTHRRSRRKAGA